MFNSYDYTRLLTPGVSHKTDWAKHKYEIGLTHAGDQYVKRDGVEWNDVTKVNVEFDIENRVPLLIIECCANIKGLESDWAEQEPFISNYTLENNSGLDTLKVYKDGELLEEVQKVEISRDSKEARLTKIKFTLLAEVDIKWDFNNLDEWLKEQTQKEHERFMKQYQATYSKDDLKCNNNT